MRSKHLPPGATVTDMFTGETVGAVDDLNSFGLELDGYQGTSLHVNGRRDLKDRYGAWPLHLGSTKA